MVSKPTSMVVVCLFLLGAASCSTSEEFPGSGWIGGKSDGQSSLDLSGLYGTRTTPTVEGITAEFARFKATLVVSSLSREQQAALQKLEEAMTVQVTSATLKRQSSQGPAWKQAIIDYVESKYDVWEDASYTDEDGRASEQCNFDDEGSQEMDMHYYTFESVKRIEGSQKSIAYIMTMIVPINGRDKDTGEMIWCDHDRTTWAFENSYVDGKVLEVEGF